MQQTTVGRRTNDVERRTWSPDFYDFTDSQPKKKAIVINEQRSLLASSQDTLQYSQYFPTL